MPKSLADLKAQRAERTRRAETFVTFYLRSETVTEYDALNKQLIEAVNELEVERQEREAGKPETVGRKSPAKRKVDKLADDLDKLADKMRDETEVTVGLAPIGGGEWNRWKADNPAREDGDGEERRIVRRDFASGGRFDFDALVESVSGYVVSINGEEATGEDWAAIEPDVTPHDLDRVATAVMNLHERSVEIPKSRKLLLAGLMSDDD